MSDGFQELRATVHQQRNELFPDLPEELVDVVLDAERANEEERDRALRDVRAAIDATVSSLVAGESEEDA